MAAEHVVAIAILYRENKFLLQLRDNKPEIFYPGYWAFFGGHLEPGEDPETGLQRELMEEIEYAADRLTFFREYSDSQVQRYVFHGPLEVGLDQLRLHEGWDMRLLTLEDIRRGSHYSERAGEIRPLGKPHQKILLDFVQGGWQPYGRPGSEIND